MIKFAFEDYEVELPEWSKHHKVVGLLVKRVYKDGETILPGSEKLKSLIEEHKEKLKAKPVQVFNFKTNDICQATDYYLPVYNQEYKEADLDYYAVGFNNTKQTTSVRLKFQIEYDTFYLDYVFDSDGSFAASLYDILQDVEGVVEEIVERGEDFSETGIKQGEEEDYRIIVVTDHLEVTDYVISKYDLLKSFVGMEVYDFKQEITD